MQESPQPYQGQDLTEEELSDRKYWKFLKREEGCKRDPRNQAYLTHEFADGDFMECEKYFDKTTCVLNRTPLNSLFISKMSQNGRSLLGNIVYILRFTLEAKWISIRRLLYLFREMDLLSQELLGATAHEHLKKLKTGVKNTMHNLFLLCCDEANADTSPLYYLSSHFREWAAIPIEEPLPKDTDALKTVIARIRLYAEHAHKGITVAEFADVLRLLQSALWDSTEHDDEKVRTTFKKIFDPIWGVTGKDEFWFDFYTAVGLHKFDSKHALNDYVHDMGKESVFPVTLMDSAGGDMESFIALCPSCDCLIQIGKPKRHEPKAASASGDF